MNLRKSADFCENLYVWALSVTLVPSPSARPDSLLGNEKSAQSFPAYNFLKPPRVMDVRTFGSRTYAQKTVFSCAHSDPRGPKDQKTSRFRSRMKFSSAPPTAALFFVRNRDIKIKMFERDQKFRSRLTISIEIKFF